MNPPFTEPVVFQEAADVLAKKLDRPTFLNTEQLAQAWDAEAKRKAFFSARVGSADLLGEIHRRLNQVIRGEMTDAQARELLRRFLEGSGADLLASLGFAPPSADGPLSELGSVRRLQLILYQNTKQAQEVGAYRQWRDNADTHPYGIWRLGISEVHRHEHALRDGKAYRFDHPVWRLDPPGGLFNCHCYRDEVSAEELDRLGVRPESQDVQVEPSPLQFDPGAGINQPVPVKPDLPPELAAQLRQALFGYRDGIPPANA